MRKMLSALVFFSLLCAAPLRAEDAGINGTPPPSTVSADDSIQHGPAEGPATPVQGTEDYDIFRLNTADHPLDSAVALLRLLPPKNKAELDAFKAENSNKLVERYDKMAIEHVDTIRLSTAATVELTQYLRGRVPCFERIAERTKAR